ncbi:hypothetical protein F4Y59_03215 [Candidatus Poribacteria bacterium]|nr:hypothetical protein [Candidatus Poribacteria bacterium]MXY27159.1 hypothetical protein [Candidatus Poribacteria bacterium]
MAYSNFTLQAAQKTFQLEIVQSIGLFAKTELVEPSSELIKALAKKVPLAVAIGTEKAKSEMIVADILVELREHFEHRISLFSGIDFNVDAENDLTGVCDFLVSLSPNQYYLEAPVIILIEAKKDDLIIGLGQCVAEMIAAQRFNTEQENDISCVYGATTTGTHWLFLKLEGKRLHIDMETYMLERCDKILGILASMVSQKA